MDETDKLQWHALNYRRIAGVQHAKEMRCDLSAFVAHKIAAAVAAERERCAKLCESARDSIWEFSDPAVKETAHNVCTNLAAAIRGN